MQDTPPSKSIEATLFPVTNCGTMAEILPLTNDWTALNKRVDQMSPNGTTNVTIGLVWAWHALTTAAPLSEAAAAGKQKERILVLLTDGTNTKNRWSTDEAEINKRTALACKNVKADGITVYAIRVIDGNASLLKACASDAKMYYEVKQASQLKSVFAAIASNLTRLHIAR